MCTLSRLTSLHLWNLSWNHLQRCITRLHIYFDHFPMLPVQKWRFHWSVLTSFLQIQNLRLILEPLSWTYWCSCWRWISLQYSYLSLYLLRWQSQSNWVARMHSSINELARLFVGLWPLASAVGLVRRGRRQGCEVHGLYLLHPVHQARRLYLRVNMLEDKWWLWKEADFPICLEQKSIDDDGLHNLCRWRIDLWNWSDRGIMSMVRQGVFVISRFWNFSLCD